MSKTRACQSVAIGWVLGLSSCPGQAPAPPSWKEATTAEAHAPVNTTLDLWAGVPPLTPLPEPSAKDLEPKPGPKRPGTPSETITLPFPPPQESAVAQPDVKSGPLTVERFGPTGDQTLVDAVRVTFN